MATEKDVNLQLRFIVGLYILNGKLQHMCIERGTCIKGLFWPPLEPKTESCFSPISSC